MDKNEKDETEHKEDKNMIFNFTKNHLFSTQLTVVQKYLLENKKTRKLRDEGW